MDNQSQNQSDLPHSSSCDSTADTNSNTQPISDLTPGELGKALDIDNTLSETDQALLAPPLMLNEKMVRVVREPHSRQHRKLTAIPSQKNMLIISLALFLLTFLSTTLVGSELYQWFFQRDPYLKQAYLEQLGILRMLATGLDYSIPVMSILLAHELGHYLQCLRYRVPATPPLFIPLPVAPLGTMGAVILQSPKIPDRKVLFDIAVSGPLAGLLIAIPLMFFALKHAKYDYVPPGSYVFGDPLIFKLVTEWYLGPAPPSHEVHVTGMGIAVWVGLLVTGLNLIPIGQLDGGHILYCLLGKRAHDLALFMTVFIGAYMLLTWNFQFILMFLLIMKLGIFHPPTQNDRIKLGWFRTILGWGTLLFLFLCFTPEPVKKVQGPTFDNRKTQAERIHNEDSLAANQLNPSNKLTRTDSTTFISSGVNS